MKKLISILALLFSTAAIAADNPIACSGASCKVKIETRDGSNVKVSAGQADGTGAWTIGPASGLTVPHTINGAGISPSTNPFTALATNQLLFGSKPSSMWITSTAGSAGINAGAYNEASGAKYGESSKYASQFIVSSTAATSGTAFGFYTSSATGTAGNAASFDNTVGQVSSVGSWTIGGPPVTGGVKQHTINGAINFTYRSWSGTSEITPANASVIQSITNTFSNLGTGSVTVWGGINPGNGFNMILFNTTGNARSCTFQFSESLLTGAYYVFSAPYGIGQLCSVSLSGGTGGSDAQYSITPGDGFTYILQCAANGGGCTLRTSSGTTSGTTIIKDVYFAL